MARQDNNSVGPSTKALNPHSYGGGYQQPSGGTDDPRERSMKPRDRGVIMNPGEANPVKYYPKEN